MALVMPDLSLAMVLADLAWPARSWQVTAALAHPGRAWLTLVVVGIGWWALGLAVPELAQAGVCDSSLGFTGSNSGHDPGLVVRACWAMALADCGAMAHSSLVLVGFWS